MAKAGITDYLGFARSLSHIKKNRFLLKSFQMKLMRCMIKL